MTPGRVVLRPARPADLPACHAVFCQAEGAVMAARGYAWPDPPFERWALTQRHILSTDPERYLVAEAAGRIVGFSAAVVRGRWWFFSALFIAPDHQGQGLGRRLFEAAAADAPDWRVTITDAIQPISTTLYGRAGLHPVTPLLTLAGSPSVAAAPELQGDVPGRPDAIMALDLAASGVDRSIDHPFWLRRAKRTLWARGGEALAYAYVWPDGQIGPLAARDRRSAGAVLRAALGAVRPGPIEVAVPGSCRELLAAALGAGLRITAPPGLLLLSRGCALPRTVAFSPSYFLP